LQIADVASKIVCHQAQAELGKGFFLCLSVKPEAHVSAAKGIDDEVLKRGMMHVVGK
jgi:hypothetical protein